MSRTKPYWKSTEVLGTYVGSVRLQTDRHRRWFDVYTSMSSQTSQDIFVRYAETNMPEVKGWCRVDYPSKRGAPAIRAAYIVTQNNRGKK